MELFILATRLYVHPIFGSWKTKNTIHPEYDTREQCKNSGNFTILFTRENVNSSRTNSILDQNS